MLILALDLGLRSGVAVGDAGGKPRVETWILKKPDEPIETAMRNLACTMRDNIIVERPDLIAAEDFLNPAAQQDAYAIISQLRMHGVVDAMAGVYGIRVVRPKADEIRVHFCGQARALPRTRGPKTKKQKAEARDATKQMVLNRAVTLGYLPRGTGDTDKADAVALWDFSCAHYARVTPKELVMFGEVRA